MDRENGIKIGLLPARDRIFKGIYMNLEIKPMQNAPGGGGWLMGRG